MKKEIADTSEYLPESVRELKRNMVIVREEEEEFRNRDKGVSVRAERLTSREEREYRDNLGVPVKYFDYDESEGGVDEVCERLNKQSIIFEYRPFYAGDDRYQIVQVVMPPRKIVYQRMVSYLDSVVKPYVLKKYKTAKVSEGLAATYFDSMNVYEKMREAQKLFANPSLTEHLISVSQAHISKEEINLIINLQTADEVFIQHDVDAYKRHAAFKQSLEMPAEGVRLLSTSSVTQEPAPRSLTSRTKALRTLAISILTTSL